MPSVRLTKARGLLRGCELFYLPALSQVALRARASLRYQPLAIGSAALDAAEIRLVFQADFLTDL